MGLLTEGRKDWDQVVQGLANKAEGLGPRVLCSKGASCQGAAGPGGHGIWRESV